MIQLPEKKLFLPLELTRREYFSKLLIAAEAFIRGYTVIFGHSAQVLSHALNQKKPGILFYKSASPAKSEIFTRLKNAGNLIIAQDEEAGISFKNYSEFFNLRQSLKNINNIDHFFCWGQDEYEFLSKTVCKNRSKEKLTLSGSPRTSLWGHLGETMFREEIAKYTKNYGNYILLVSNFVSPNPLVRDNNIDTGNLERENRNIKKFRELVAILSKNGINTVIRPHPAENEGGWDDLTKLPYVFVKSTGDITPLILGSKMVVHNSCTSGIQSVMSNKYVFSYGDKDELTNFMASVPNIVSHITDNSDEIIKRYRLIMKRGDSYKNNLEDKANFLDKKIHMSGSNEPAKIILDKIEEKWFFSDKLDMNSIYLHNLAMKSIIKKLIHKFSINQKDRIVKGKQEDMRKDRLLNDFKKSMTIQGGYKNFKMSIYHGKVAVFSHKIKD